MSFYTLYLRAKRLVKEGVSRSSGAAKVAQMVERESGTMRSSDTIGIYSRILFICPFCRYTCLWQAIDICVNDVKQILNLGLHTKQR